MSDKCFCHFNGYEVKDAKARSEIENIKDKSPLFLSVFFDNDEKLQFYNSKDLINYSKLNIDENIVARDPSVIEVDGTLYIACTKQTNTCDFLLIKTSDLVNFETIDINLGMDKSRNRWAPSLMLDNNKIVLTITSRATDGSNSYIYKCESLKDNISFSSPVKIELDRNIIIDSHIIKYNGIYYMLVKDESLIKTCLYKSNDNLNYTFVREINEFPEGKNKCEGAFALALEDKIFIGCDNYDSPSYNRSLQLGLFTNNIEVSNKANSFILNNGNESVCRHGSTIKIENLKLKSIINAKQKTITSKYNNRYSLQDLSNYATSNVIEDLYVFPGVVYTCSNKHITINKLHNPFGVDRVNFMFRGNESTKITVVNNGVNNINKSILNSKLINETIITFEYTNEGFYPVNHYDPQLTWTKEIGTGTVDVELNLNNPVFVISTNGDRTVNVTSGIINDIYFHITKSVTGNLTFRSATIDLSTIPADSLIHFKRYGSSYLRVN